MKVRHEIEKNNSFSKAVFHGFVLKRSFWYGYMDGKPIAFCEKPDREGNLKVYIQESEMNWKPYVMKKDEMKKIYPNFAEVA